MQKKTFRKEERLCSRRSIGDLFHNGSSFVFYPYRIIFSRPEADQRYGGEQVRILVSVPKRKFKRASARNLIKRRLKEAYRLQKSGWLNGFPEIQDNRLDFAIQYLSSEILAYEVLSDRMTEALIKLRTAYAKLYLGKDH